MEVKSPTIAEGSAFSTVSIEPDREMAPPVDGVDFSNNTAFD